MKPGLLQTPCKGEAKGSSLHLCHLITAEEVVSKRQLEG